MRKVTYTLLLVLVLVLVGVAQSIPGTALAHALTPPTPPFTQCPHVGADTSCAILIVFNAGGTINVLGDSSQGPFDGIEDTLVGVQNNSGLTIPNMTISGSGIFGFDGDGLCTFGVTGCPFGTTGYEGPNTSFSIVDANNGTVHFTGGLAVGQSAYFSLEEALTAASITIVRPTTLTYTGATTSDFNDPATLSAHLVDSMGAAVPGATITFNLAAQSCMGTTNSSGDASCTITPNEAAGGYVVHANFAGMTSGFIQYQPSAVSNTFVVTLEETTISYTGPTLVAQGQPATLSAVLKEDGTTPISGRTVTLTLSSQSCTGTTDGSGSAKCTISSVSCPLGNNTVTASFAGDTFYKPASDSKQVPCFAFLASGSFVLGDQTASSALSSGATVTWWGAQWSKLNSLSGGSAPSAFKGFAQTPSATPPTCGGTWTTDTGNSSGPPTSVPSYMAVIVASNVTQSGSTISGNIVSIVIVKTNPGYANNPGHPGTGTVVAVLCSAEQGD